MSRRPNKFERGWAKFAQSVTGYVAPYWTPTNVRGAAMMTPAIVKKVEQGVLGGIGGVAGAIGGAAEAGQTHGWRSFVGLGNYPGAFRNAWSTVGNTASDVAKELSRPEVAERVNGALGSAIADTAYNFVPSMVGIVSDKGAQKVREAQDVIGLGKIRQAADDYDAKTKETQFRHLYGDEGWAEYAQNPMAFAQTHPEVMVSDVSDTVGRGSLGMAAVMKGFGAAGRAVHAGNKIKALSFPFQHPITTSAIVGAGSGVKSGIESGSVLQGVSTGLNDAAITSMILGGSPVATGSMLTGGVVTTPEVVSTGKDIIDGIQGKELPYRDPKVRQATEDANSRINDVVSSIESSPGNNKELYDAIINNPSWEYADENIRKRLEAIGQKMGW